VIRLLVVLLAVTACDPAAANPPDGAALLERFECARCHDGTGAREAARDKHCVACHREIRAGTFDAPKPAVLRWRKNLRSLNHVPSLASAGARLRRGYVRSMLLAPIDARPALPATMPRLRMSPEEADAIAAHLVPSEAPPARFSTAEVVRGASLYTKLQCASCHVYTGVTLAPANAPGPAHADSPGIELAPDLAWTRTRIQPAAIATILREPKRLNPDSAMPSFAIDDADARALAAYVLLAPIVVTPPPAAPARLPRLDRPVGWDEVERRIFRKVCWHCHSSPAFGMGDGGAGNTGGFGYPGRGLDLSSPTGLLSGSLGDDGKRRSVFSPLPDGTPRLLGHLLARQREVEGHLPDIVGMPLGLPPLPPEDIQLLESWIAQDHPL
jgi:mono/diheme cytochrome c family protein